MVVTSYEICKRLTKAAIHKADQRYTFLFSGGHSNSILSSVEEIWDRQRRVIHSFIAARKSRFEAETRAVASAILTLDETDLAVDLRCFVGERVSSISRRALGDDEGKGGPFPGDAIGTEKYVRAFFALNLVSTSMGCDRLLGPVLRRAGAAVLRRTAHERALRRYVREAESPFVRELVKEFGEEETLGHLWVITLGSTLPEISMICKTLQTLAANQTLQQEIYQLIQGDNLDTVRVNTEFTDWVVSQCSKNLFFPVSGKYVDKSITLGEQTIPKGQKVVIRYDDARDNDGAGASFPWGFGPRACPGALIGKDVVRSVVFAVLHTYQLVEADASQSRSLRETVLAGLSQRSQVRLMKRPTIALAA